MASWDNTNDFKEILEKDNIKYLLVTSQQLDPKEEEYTFKVDSNIELEDLPNYIDFLQAYTDNLIQKVMIANEIFEEEERKEENKKSKRRKNEKRN